MKNKERYTLELEADQMLFIQSLMEKYDVGEEDKIVRIMLDYVLTSPKLHDEIFTEVRCLRCE